MTYFIAELGANIFPFSRSRLARFVEAAAEAGADAVKVQLFRADHFPVAERREKIQHEFPRYEFDWFLRMARAFGLEAGASVFDEDAIELCRDADFIKLAAREANNRILLEAAYLGYRRGPVYRSLPVRALEPGWAIGVLEHALGCVSMYPTPSSDAADALGGLPTGWGWSSHTTGYEDCMVAARFGAPVIEKHFKLAGVEAGEQAEASWSLFPWDFARMVEECRGL